MIEHLCLSMLATPVCFHQSASQYVVVCRASSEWEQSLSHSCTWWTITNAHLVWEVGFVVFCSNRAIITRW